MISECCYAEDRAINLDGPMWSEIMICPECRDNAVFIEASTLEKIEKRKGRIYELEQIINGLTDDGQT